MGKASTVRATEFDPKRPCRVCGAGTRADLKPYRGTVCERGHHLPKKWGG